ncbi:hypothetical protein TorRG33x02_048180 [Trema orientale]|uniref:Uncharacterized protein n=1 Tax=Trema orientale TaxID=63057 RepID=A0A2P5FNA2_TREOI|nr:hypothetical protein TorRG33x02_048180 [Trema orientale]
MGVVLHETLHMPIWRFRPRCHRQQLHMVELRRSTGGSRAMMARRRHLDHDKGVGSKGRGACVREKENLGRF